VQLGRCPFLLGNDTSIDTNDNQSWRPDDPGDIGATNDTNPGSGDTIGDAELRLLCLAATGHGELQGRDLVPSERGVERGDRVYRDVQHERGGVPREADAGKRLV
jgi:hypothetical protein